MRRLLDAHGGVIKEFVHDEGENHTFIHTTQDVAPYFDANQEFRTSGSDGYSQSRAFKHIATVPHIIADKWCIEDGITRVQFNRMPGKEKAAYIKRKLNNPDYAYMRTFWAP